MLTVDLLRHGEVVGAASVARGCGTDVPLTQAGLRQMQAVADVLPGPPLGGIARSALARGCDFAGRPALWGGLSPKGRGHWGGGGVCAQGG